jgi:protein disulfide-isomerase
MIVALFLLIPGLVLAIDSQWTEDFDQAKIEAQAADKYLLVDFSGSDWCHWCKKLDKDVFRTDVFKTFAADNLILVSIDFPKRIKQSDVLIKRNDELLRQYAVRGFPTVIIMTPDGEVIDVTGYRPGGAKSYVTYLRDTIDKSRTN